MFVIAMWQWWYVQGWLAITRRVGRQLHRIAQMFSLGLLLRTLAAPWKQTVNVAGPNTPLQVRLQWWLGNQISRVVGFFVRLGTLLAGIVILAVTGLAGGLLILLWPLLPATSLGLVIIGLVLSIWM